MAQNREEILLDTILFLVFEGGCNNFEKNEIRFFFQKAQKPLVTLTFGLVTPNSTFISRVLETRYSHDSTEEEFCFIRQKRSFESHTKEMGVRAGQNRGSRQIDLFNSVGDLLSLSGPVLENDVCHVSGDAKTNS